MNIIDLVALRAEKKMLKNRWRVKRAFWTLGYIKKIQEKFAKDKIYMARFQWCERHTSPPGWYKVTGPARYETKRLDGKTWTTTGFDNDMLGKIVRPVPPKLGDFCSVGHLVFEVLERSGDKTVRRYIYGTSFPLELTPLSRIFFTERQAKIEQMMFAGFDHKKERGDG